MGIHAEGAAKALAEPWFDTPTPFPSPACALKGRICIKEPAKWAIESLLSAPRVMWVAKC